MKLQLTLVLAIIPLVCNGFVLVDIARVDGEAIAVNRERREAVKETQQASLFAPINLKRGNHYWTRKRGNERATSAPQYAYTLYPTQPPPRTGMPQNNIYGNSRR